jgi:tRNA-dihydrouridine synthase B
VNLTTRDGPDPHAPAPSVPAFGVVQVSPLLRPLRLGGLTLDVPVLQGALSGFSDLAMRRVARAFGCAYAVNEVVLDENVVKPGKLQQEILRVPDDDHPVGGQILGATPVLFAEAAKLMVAAGYDVIDINFGCPVNKVLGRCRGGYLVGEPRTALEIVSRVREAVPPHVPLTLKMRRGIDDTELAAEMFEEIFVGAFDRGVDAICVHGRTVQQKYVGPSNRTFLKDLKARHPTRTIIGSGDLFEAGDVKALLDDTGVDGAWVARGAIGAPWIFREARALLTTGALPPPPTLSEQRFAVRMHRRESEAVHGHELGNRLFRSAAIKYAEAHPRADDVKAALYACKVPVDIDAVVDAFYADAFADDHFGPVVRRAGPGNLVAAGARA